MKENINVVRDFANLPMFEVASPKDKKDTRNKLKATLRSTDFYDNLTIADKILQPLCHLIIAFQGNTLNYHDISEVTDCCNIDDKKPISYVQHTIEELTGKIYDIRELSKCDKDTISQQVENRWNFLYSECHGLSYLLDPKLKGQHMAKEDKDALIATLNNKCHSTQAVLEYDSYDKFLIDISEDDDPRHALHCQIHEDTMTAMGFWKCAYVMKNFPSLAKLARSLFSLVPSSSASERNFSTFSFIHTKLRNRLLTDKVQKLVFIKGNSSKLSSVEKTPEEEDDELYGLSSSD
jgi:hypothetical protein